MSDERIRASVAFSERLRRQRCTTPGHEDRKGDWLIDGEPNRGRRWVCRECRDAEPIP